VANGRPKDVAAQRHGAAVHRTLLPPGRGSHRRGFGRRAAVLRGADAGAATTIAGAFRDKAPPTGHF